MKDAYKNLPQEARQNSEIARQIKFQEEKREKARLLRKKRLSFIIGLAVIFFSVIGFAALIHQAVIIINGKAEEKKQLEYNFYNTYLIPAAAVDPQPFDDVTGAPMEELVEIAVWSIIGSELNPNKYDYSSGELAIPEAEVEQAFYSFFSSQVKIQHCTVTGYGYEFKYNAEKKSYFIPLTTLEPLYTPEIVKTESSGGVTEITCGLIKTDSFTRDGKTGRLLPSEPDKYIKVTLREFSGKSYISALQTSGTPETAR